jgi:hypothetical protein
MYEDRRRSAENLGTSSCSWRSRKGCVIRSLSARSNSTLTLPKSMSVGSLAERPMNTQKGVSPCDESFSSHIRPF